MIEVPHINWDRSSEFNGNVHSVYLNTWKLKQKRVRERRGFLKFLKWNNDKFVDYLCNNKLDQLKKAGY